MILEFTAVDFAYRRGVKVLDGISFAVTPGEVIGLLGKNGAGKTTLINIATGLLEPRHGTVRLFGQDPLRDALHVKRRIGYVSEDQILPEYLRVSEVIGLHRELFPQWDAALEKELSQRFAISPRDRIKNLSKGQARQIALLCAVCHRPELLLLDEPAGGLDPATRRGFLETAIRMLQDRGTTIVFSSHYMSDVERLAGRVVMLHDGHVLIDSALDQLREGFSLVRIPPGAGATQADLMSEASCLGVRERADGLHAVFRLATAQAPQILANKLGIAGARCVPVTLEEMFIELAGAEGPRPC